MRSLLRRVAGLPVISVPRDAVDTMIDDMGMEMAGYIAFTGLLAIFPFLVFLAALSGFLSAIPDNLSALQAGLDMLPKDVAGTLKPVIDEIIERRSGSLLTFGLLGALWVASSGFDSLRIALNTAYDVDEPRPWPMRKVVSISAVLIGGAVFILLSVLVILGPLIWDAILWISPLTGGDRWAFSLLRYAFSVLLVFAALLALHRWLPGRYLTWRELFPGVLVTTILWLAAASLFSYYVSNLGDYGATYGSLGGVIVTLLFFYISALLFIFGAELNAAISRRHGAT